MNKIVELIINLEEFEFDDLGVEIMSLVDRPAIEVGWMAFNEDGMECQDCFDLDGACWPGYEAIGMKTLNGKQVPNCVPVENSLNSQDSLFESFTDYPEGAKNNAKRAIEYKEANDISCCTIRS